MHCEPADALWRILFPVPRAILGQYWGLLVPPGRFLGPSRRASIRAAPSGPRSRRAPTGRVGNEGLVSLSAPTEADRARTASSHAFALPRRPATM
eukprot:5961246-Pyramimonas_sp.AAC.1